MGNGNGTGSNDGGHNCNNDPGGCERNRWASVPGTKLHVDIANIYNDNYSKKKGGTSSSSLAAADQEKDDDEKYDTSKWKSYHYDYEELNDDSDLYNPDRLDSRNKFDVMEGANDAGMFLR